MAGLPWQIEHGEADACMPPAPELLRLAKYRDSFFYERTDSLTVAARCAAGCLIPSRDRKEAVPAWKNLSLYYAKLNS
jgi:hypothetical protein